MGDTTAGIRQAGDIGVSGSQSPLDMVAKVVGIQNAQTLNKLYGQHIENLQTEQLAKKQEMTKNNSHFMSGMLFSDLLSGASPEQLNQRFEFAKTLPNADVATITAAQNEFNRVPDADKSRWVFSLGASSLSPDMQQKTYGQVVSATDPDGRTSYHVIPQPGSPMKPYQAGGPIGGGMSADSGGQLGTIHTEEGDDIPITLREAPGKLQELRNQGKHPGPFVPSGAAPAQQPGGPTGPPSPAQSGQPKIGQGPTVSTAPAQGATGPTPPSQYVTPSKQKMDLAAQSREDARQMVLDMSSQRRKDLDASLEFIRTASPATLAQFGEGTEIGRHLRQVVSNLSPSAASFFGVDPKEQVDPQIMVKMMNRVAGKTGSRSDMELANQLGSGPNPKLTGQALVRVAAYVRGLNMEDDVKNRAAIAEANAAGHPAMNPEKHVGNIKDRLGGQVDPNVFQYVAAGDKKGLDEYYNTKLTTKEARDKAKYTRDLIIKYGQPVTQAQ